MRFITNPATCILLLYIRLYPQSTHSPILRYLYYQINVIHYLATYQKLNSFLWNYSIPQLLLLSLQIALFIAAVSTKHYLVPKGSMPCRLLAGTRIRLGSWVKQGRKLERTWGLGRVRKIWEYFLRNPYSVPYLMPPIALSTIPVQP